MINPIKLTNIIIHGFALLHATVSLVLRLSFDKDELALTMLTIAMVVYLSRVWKAPLYIAMSLAVIASVAGHYIGITGADLLYSGLGIFRNCFMTFLISETIGWLVFLVVRKK